MRNRAKLFVAVVAAAIVHSACGGGAKRAEDVAPPVANGFFLSVIAAYGDQVIAASAIIDRLVPVAFGGLFALSGAVGPILGQNWGAGRFDRLQVPITMLFKAEGMTADLVRFFCTISGFSWFFIGLLFVANASFNNLGFPLFSTAFNWARATLGMAPFAVAGATFAGPEGALLGIGVGSAPFGLAAILTAFGAIRRLERRARTA